MIIMKKPNGTLATTDPDNANNFNTIFNRTPINIKNVINQSNDEQHNMTLPDYLQWMN
jgi:hypothetical protein